MTTLISSKGNITLQDNINNVRDELNWNANYDGETANIKLNVVENERKNVDYKLKMNNNDLAKMLSIPSVDTPIDERLENDFLLPLKASTKPNPYLFPVNMSKRSIDPYQDIDAILREEWRPSFADTNDEIDAHAYANASTLVSPTLMRLISSSNNHNNGTRRRKRRKHLNLYNTPLPKTLHMHFKNANGSSSSPSNNSTTSSSTTSRSTTYSKGRGITKKRIHHSRRPHKNKTKNNTKRTTKRTLSKSLSNILQHYVTD